MREDLGILHDDETILLGELQGEDAAAARLVYRDWLEEHGDERAEVLRLEQAIAASKSDEADRAALREELRRLHQRLRHQWRAWLRQVSQATVENCHGPPRRRRKEGAGNEQVEFKFVCPKTWDGLQTTHDDSVRFCSACHQHVFFCDTVEDANDLAVLGHCVAIDASQVRHEGDFQQLHGAILGMVRTPTRVANFYDEVNQREAKPIRRRRRR
jgi:uncharacterized protein (TIGR02996 family)